MLQTPRVRRGLLSHRHLFRTSTSIAAGLMLGNRSESCPRVFAADDTPQRPFPQHLAYASGTIRPDHRTQQELDDDVRSAYDRWKSHYLVEAGTGEDGPPAIGLPSLNRTRKDTTSRSRRDRASGW